MTKELQIKSNLMNAILLSTPHPTADMFFALAFSTNRELEIIYAKLNIKL